MDFWNRKKVKELEETIAWQKKEIAEKDRTNKRLKVDLDRINKKADELTRKIQGDRVCDGYCEKCTHAIITATINGAPIYEYIICELDCKCKDFQRKDAES